MNEHVADKKPEIKKKKNSIQHNSTGKIFVWPGKTFN